MRKFFWIVLVPAIVFASTWNSWQLFQPSNRNYTNRTASNGYSPGYPADASNFEPDVVAQWLFDEPSGSIVDEVSGITLTNDMATASYGVTSSGLFATLSPGIRATYNLGDAPARFIKSTGTASLDIGSTTSVTVESYFSVTRNNADPAWWSIMEYGTTEGANLFAIYFYTVTASNNLTWYIRSSDNTALFATWTAPQATIYDGNTHKLRMVWNRGTNLLEAILDGNSLGTVSAASLNGKTLTNGSVMTHGIWLSEEGSNNTLYNLRVSHNASNNMGGPGGG